MLRPQFFPVVDMARGLAAGSASFDVAEVIVVEDEVVPYVDELELDDEDDFPTPCELAAINDGLKNDEEGYIDADPIPIAAPLPYGVAASLQLLLPAPAAQ
ncbi:hypothetical protein EST38_g11646 [Candolleomyces aberdarensis]|uniref:Uncharacterized protein n=1 Tax=Candolleomyces aberdarensis TaxID=2316362 RepID=A0A4V1Q285_9AGAR|nr:hypothetical protein EST38_g11646 [Candolleomyces aberdarensis]